MIDEATRAQNEAADPRHSTWLSANAGSGKTRVLTDRVARLLLNGSEPQNILCLTYTKAAASEMQNRLFQRLGRWAMLPEDELLEELRTLGAEPSQPLTRARTLFARAVEAPGGLKIQTIHSFCSSVLRQFPLEAGVSPRFQELDEHRQAELIQSALDKLAASGCPALGPVAQIASDGLVEVAKSVANHRECFERKLSRGQIFGFFGISPNQTADDLVASVFQDGAIEFLHRSAAVIEAHGGPRDKQLAAKLATIPKKPSLRGLQIAESCLLTSKEPFESKVGAIPTKAVREGPFLPYLDRFNAIIDRVADTRDWRVSFEAANRSAALHDFAQVFLPAYEQAKSEVGALDFDDLIQKTRALLGARSLEWVLYRLDARIEHILVDEAQDTSPVQWEVIDALTREIMAGEGTRAERSIFVVGDKKQSIYSFQGADAAAFDRMRDNFTSGPSNAPTLQSHELHFSFRSSTAILRTVDAVFEGDAGRGVGKEIQHRAFHEALPGRVDLWPLITSPKDENPPEWYDPVDRLATNHPRIELAEKIADTIRDLIEKGTITGDKGVTRRIHAGDFLILVQGRSGLFDQIIRACKAKGLPMAGADRLKIGGELAVKDLLALLSFLALQEDSLSLAAALKSPLFGWSEKQLFDLAQGRGKRKYLWHELRDRKADFPETFGILDHLLGQVDFLRPYELLELILTRHHGRRNLLARLGPEAEDGIDELLNQALAYEQGEVPSLTGFLTRAQSEEVEIKRQSDSSGGQIRVMTVHGAKGLESPIVILPDTTRAEKVSSDPILQGHDGTPFWRMSAAECPEALVPAREQAKAADQDERRRLLYVAMTRAEKWLIVCGVENKQCKSGHWHDMVKESMAAMAADTIDTPTGTGLRVSHEAWPDVAIAPGTAKKETKPGELPPVLTTPAKPLLSVAGPLAPSDLGGAKVLDGGARDEEQAKNFGRLMHRLLELLPKGGSSLDDAIRILENGPDPIMGEDVAAMLDQATRVINAYPNLFSDEALAEVDVSAFLPSIDRQIAGTIDRLVIGPDTVTAVDFKTNAIIPTVPADVPEGILRQMGAYLEALEQIFPDKRIILKVIWTEDASETALEHGIVRAALARTQHLDVPTTPS